MRIHQLRTAIQLAAHHQLALPPTTLQQTSTSGVSVSVLVIVVMGGTGWYMVKHKKIKVGPAIVFFALGLGMAGTQLGGMVAQMLANFGAVLNQLIGSS